MGRRIGGAGGGSDKGSSKGGPLLIGIVLAVALGAGGTAAIGASGATGSGASSGVRGGSRVNSQNSIKAEARLTRLGVRVTARATDDAANCAEHSYGQTQDFFRRRPCSGLHRALLQLRDSEGDVVLLAIAWVEMPDEAGARSLQELLDTGGTGNITELSREKGRYQSVRYTGDAYTSSRDGTVVTNAQAQPVARGWSGLALTSIVTNAVR